MIAALAFGLATAHAARAETAEPLPAPTAGAAEGTRAAAKARFDDAERAARELRFADALAAYRAAAALDPSAPFAPAARARADALATHAEGGFAPLARLEQVRRDPVKMRDAATIEALARDAATFPPGRVRAEARLVAAEAFAHVLGDPRRAVGELDAVVADDAADRLTRSLALNELVSLERGLGDLDAARDAVVRWGDLSPAVRAQVLRLVRRVSIRRASLGLLAAIAIAAAAAAIRIARRRGARELPRALVRPLSVGFALYVGGGGAIVARLYGTDDPRPFLWLGLGVLALDVMARALRIASEGAGKLVAVVRTAACVGGVLAVAFLALERTQAGYLESFGL